MEYEIYSDHYGHDEGNLGHQKLPEQTKKLIDRKFIFYIYIYILEIKFKVNQIL